ncbi:ANTAR domain-containing protein [Arthrobacter sp. MDT2-16]
MHRAVIEQAKGILMGRTGLNAAEAFQRISQYSQRNNRKVVVVSQEIIDRAVTLTRQTQHQSSDHALLDPFTAL